MPKKRKAGRPKLPKNEGRVVLSGRVLPVTKTMVQRLAKQTKQSVGELMDERFSPVKDAAFGPDMHIKLKGDGSTKRLGTGLQQ